jgi:DNA-binding FadR family transcriptional regulator
MKIIQLTADLVLAIDHYKKTGEFEPVRQTNTYREMLAAMPTPDTEALDAAMRHIAENIKPMTKGMLRAAGVR